MMGKSLLLGGILVALGLACAAPKPVVKPPPRPRPAPIATPAPPPPKKIKLAVLPVERLLLPKVAEALNEKLRAAVVGGVSETTTATISMEVAAMQLDCTEPTSACYGQIAKHFEADRLLWAEIERMRSGRRRHAAAPTTIRIVLFDVERGAVIGRAEETFAGAVSNEALDRLLGRAVALPPATAENRASQP
jgi:hypothetical protein